MKYAFPISKSYYLAAVFFLVIISTAWRGKENSDFAKEYSFYEQMRDTTGPGERSEDAVLPAIKALEKELKIIQDQVIKNVNEAISKVQLEKALQDAESALKEIDWTAMEKNTANALKEAKEEIMKIDMSALEKELQAVKEEMHSEEFKKKVNSEKIMQELKDAMEKVKEAMDEVKTNIKNENEFKD